MATPTCHVTVLLHVALLVRIHRVLHLQWNAHHVEGNLDFGWCAQRVPTTGNIGSACSSARTCFTQRAAGHFASRRLTVGPERSHRRANSAAKPEVVLPYHNGDAL